MAWSAPRTWVTGEVVTASIMNVHVRDNFVALTSLSRVQFTANVAITATTEATANTIVTAGALTFDGASAALVEFFAPSYEHTTANTRMTLVLYDGASAVGWMAIVQPAFGGNPAHPINASYRLTPSAASHTYSVRAYTTTGTGTIYGGAAGAGAVVPGFIRVVSQP